MSQHWDDDEDFGTFECADAPEEALKAPPTPSKIPAWLLDTQSIKSSTTDGLSRNTSKTSSKESLQQEPVVPVISGAGVVTLQTTSDSPKLLDADSTKAAASEAPSSSADPYQALRQVELVTSQSPAASSIQQQQQPSTTVVVVGGGVSDNPSPATASAAREETTTAAANVSSTPVGGGGIVANDVRLNLVRNSLVTELETKLNAAVVMKEQSERNLRELRLNLSNQLEDMLKSQEQRNKAHQEEMEEMKRQHEQQITHIKQQYTETSEMITRQLHEMYEAQMKSERLEQEQTVSQITQQCLQLMTKQEEVLSAKVAETLEGEKKKFESMKEELKVELNELIQSSAEEITQKITTSNQKEMETMLKKSIEDELEEQRRVTSQLQRDTHAELMTSFKEQLSSDMAEERTRNEKKMTEMVEETRKNVIECCQRETKRNDTTRQRHVAAIQMLISSSQEHLSKLSCSLQESGGDS